MCGITSMVFMDKNQKYDFDWRVAILYGIIAMLCIDKNHNYDLNWGVVIMSRILDMVYIDKKRVVQGYSRDTWLADFIFRETWILGNFSSWFVTWRFCVTHERPELLTDIGDFTTLYYVILRCKSSEWLKWSMSIGWLRYAICNIWSLDLAIHDFDCF